MKAKNGVFELKKGKRWRFGGGLYKIPPPLNFLYDKMISYIVEVCRK